jgi:hypothetical protein
LSNASQVVSRRYRRGRYRNAGSVAAVEGRGDYLSDLPVAIGKIYRRISAVIASYGAETTPFSRRNNPDAVNVSTSS